MTACDSRYGNEVRGGNLTVYFTDAKDELHAEKIALFWKEHDLLGKGKQDLQLIRNGGVHELRLIANKPSTVKSMKFEEFKLLNELQTELRNELSIPDLELVICDAKFEPIYTLDK